MSKMKSKRLYQGKIKNTHRYQKIAACVVCTLALGFAMPNGIVWADGAKQEADQMNEEVTEAKEPVVLESTDSELDSYTLDTVTVEAKRPDWESKLSPGTVTVIRPDDYKGEQKTLPELLKMVPGVHVREVNGKGQYTTVTVRGSTSAQVGVFVDGVLFNLGGDAAADISTIPVQNVERIEVYRGYVPARFGGTYMGGVINIVTKRPTKANIDASIGKSSYGGFQGALQVDAPLGSGSIMFGLNRDQSDGDFKYTNKSVDTSLYDGYVKKLKDYTHQTDRNGKIRLDRMVSTLQANGYDTLNAYSGLTQDNLRITLATDPNFYAALNKASEQLRPINNAHANYIGYFKSYIDNIRLYQKDIDSTSTTDRWRKTNDYKNTDAILKWQDDHWLAKYTWKKIDRHYPFPLNANYGNIPNIDLPGYLDPIYNYRHQDITSKETLIGRRDTVGNLEWGWSVNYLDQTKRYAVDDWQEKEKVDTTVNWRSPNYYWSQYDMDKLGFKIDGTYKIGDKHLFEFLIDTSKEKMDMDGWRLKQYQQATISVFKRWRTYYEQKLFNAQIQDTITLNEKGDFWLTPSIRYNRSNIYGLSNGYDQNSDPQNIKWLHQADDQTDSKTTWQLALKKQVNDNLTLRATGGTYFRLLNMYEIAGDGAGILPMPNIGGSDSIFPRPEEGSQWDVSAIWDGQIFGTESSKIQLTYFGRDSKRMLQLGTWNNFFFVYTNAASAKVNGLEIQADLSWKKWDLNLQGTYTKPKDVIYDLSKLPGAGYWGNNGVFPGYLTYQPEWEGTMRLTYRPSTQWGIFGQLRYVDRMRTSLYNDGAAGEQSSLTTLDLGVKYKPNTNTQIIIGVNDLLNKANDMYLTNPFYPNWEASNIQYPIQGRTYYATLQYNF